MKSFSYRYATENDTQLILSFIRGLAEYEKMSDLVVATPELLKHWIFDCKKAEVVFALEGEKEVGFRVDNGRYILDIPAYTLDPVVLFIDK